MSSTVLSGDCQDVNHTALARSQDSQTKAGRGRQSPRRPFKREASRDPLIALADEHFWYWAAQPLIADCIVPALVDRFIRNRSGLQGLADTEHNEAQP